MTKRARRSRRRPRKLSARERRGRVEQGKLMCETAKEAFYRTIAENDPCHAADIHEKYEHCAWAKRAKRQAKSQQRKCLLD